MEAEKSVLPDAATIVLLMEGSLESESPTRLVAIGVSSR